METESQKNLQGNDTQHAELHPVEQMFFEQHDTGPVSQRRASTPAPAAVIVGEFIGDPLADAWLR